CPALAYPRTRGVPRVHGAPTPAHSVTASTRSTRPESEPTLLDSSAHTGSRPRNLSSSTSTLAPEASRSPEGRSKFHPDRRSPGVGPGRHHGAPLSLQGDVRRTRGAPPIPLDDFRDCSSPATGHRLRRGGERGAQMDVRRAEGLLHEERQPHVENLGPVELAERAVDVCKIGQRPDQPQILRPESTLEEGESLLVEQLRLLVGAAVGGVLGPQRELERALAVVEPAPLSGSFARSSVADEV